MPAYATSNAPINIRANSPSPLWNNEAIVTGGKSAQAFLGPNNQDNLTSFSIYVQFSAAPGAYTLSIQVADQDVDTAYVSLATTLTAVDATNFNARADISNVVAGKFMRLLMTLLTNAVNVTARAAQ